MHLCSTRFGSPEVALSDATHTPPDATRRACRREAQSQALSAASSLELTIQQVLFPLEQVVDWVLHEKNYTYINQTWDKRTSKWYRPVRPNPRRPAGTLQPVRGAFPLASVALPVSAPSLQTAGAFLSLDPAGMGFNVYPYTSLSILHLNFDMLNVSYIRPRVSGFGGPAATRWTQRQLLSVGPPRQTTRRSSPAWRSPTSCKRLVSSWGGGWRAACQASSVVAMAEPPQRN